MFAGFEACKNTMFACLTEMLSLSHTSTAEKEIYLHSLIDFENKISVHAIGALLKFLTKYWTQFVNDSEVFNVLDINQISL